ncbi:hypothetical protein V2I01_32230 [Micromonospora sp. BRA006-A]|nr:hypothetical protein [Micromonospora sp. BRA006-A]
MTRTAPAVIGAALAAVVASAVLALTPLPASAARPTVTPSSTQRSWRPTGASRREPSPRSRSGSWGRRTSGRTVRAQQRADPAGRRHLTDGARLRAGWVLVLPWDAYGSEVRQGVPPVARPAPGRSTPDDGQRTADGDAAARPPKGAAPSRRRAPPRRGPVRAWPPTRRGRTAGAGTSSWQSSTPASPAVRPRSPAG